FAALTQHLAHSGRRPPGAGGRGTRHHGYPARYVTATRSPAVGEGGCALSRTARDRGANRSRCRGRGSRPWWAYRFCQGIVGGAESEPAGLLLWHGGAAHLAIDS